MRTATADAAAVAAAASFSRLDETRLCCMGTVSGGMLGDRGLRQTKRKPHQQIFINISQDLLRLCAHSPGDSRPASVAYPGHLPSLTGRHYPRNQPPARATPHTPTPTPCLCEQPRARRPCPAALPLHRRGGRGRSGGPALHDGFPALRAMKLISSLVAAFSWLCLSGFFLDHLVWPRALNTRGRRQDSVISTYADNRADSHPCMCC